jgi:hypothetical protein
MDFGRNTAAAMPERARGSDWGMKSGSRCGVDPCCRCGQATFADTHGNERVAPIADPPPTTPTQAKRCLSARRGQSTADGGACRVCKRAICGCSKTLKTATVVSTPLGIW